MPDKPYKILVFVTLWRPFRVLLYEGERQKISNVIRLIRIQLTQNM